MSRRRFGLVALWVAAAVAATSFGLIAVGLVGSAATDRGPIGTAVGRPDATPQGPPVLTDPDVPRVTREITDDFGTFAVRCVGAYASGIEAQGAPGWRVVRFEPGPDDDVAAVFASEAELVEIEVFCNQGAPTVSEIDRSRVPNGQA